MTRRSAPVPAHVRATRILVAAAALLLTHALLFGASGQGGGRCAFGDLADAADLLRRGALLALPAELDGAIPAPCEPGEPMYLVYLAEEGAPDLRLPAGVVAVNAISGEATGDAPGDTVEELVDWFWTVATTPRGDVVNAVGGFTPVFIAEGRAFLVAQQR